MSVYINGVKLLNANLYDTIIIKEKENGYRITIRGSKETITCTNSEYKFSEELKKISDEEQIIKVTDSFLKSTKINHIGYKKIMKGYEGDFCVVKGNRELDLCLKKDLKELQSLLINKYLIDRFCFLNDNNDISCYEIKLGFNKSSYKIENTKLRRKIVYEIMYDNNLQVPDYEKDFLIGFLYEKVCNSDEDVIIKNRKTYFDEGKFHIENGDFLMCGNLEVKLDCHQNIINTVNQVINKYNNEREKVKKKQLKLEGI